MNMLRRHWPWLLVLVILLAFPFLFYDWSKGRHSGFVLTLMSEIGVMAIFALSYNMLMGQAGLLSFGHAVLFGLGAYCAAHVVLRLAERDEGGRREAHVHVQRPADRPNDWRLPDRGERSRLGLRHR